MLKAAMFVAALMGVWFCAAPSRAQHSPADVSGCDLAKNAKSFDGKAVRVRGTLSVHFEDFTLRVPNCQPEPMIWLAFGGDVPGIVASMANDNVRKPGSDVVVNGVAYGLKNDDNFRKLYALVASRHGDKADYQVTATLTGVFLAGQQSKTEQGATTYSGYGHLGCCSLLVITQVFDVEATPPANLEIRGTVFGPSGEPVVGLAVIDEVLGGSPPQRQTTITDAQGRFSFSNSGQQLRIEDPRYRPLAVTAEPGRGAVRLKLEEAKKSDWVIPACGANARDRIGFSLLFAIPATLDASPFDDRGQQTFFIFPKGQSPAEARLILARRPEEEVGVGDSIDSEWVKERWLKDRTGRVIGIDSRGLTIGGGHWRTVSFQRHEAASYSLQPGEQSKLLDETIDSACVAEPATN